MAADYAKNRSVGIGWGFTTAAVRLLHGPFACDPIQITEAQVRDYFLLVKLKKRRSPSLGWAWLFSSFYAEHQL
jgi:hypothetical protein